MMKMKNPEIFRYVGAIQDFGVPFVSLFVDEATRELYLLVRLDLDNESSEEYVAVRTSVKEIEAYMDNSESLSDIFRDKKKLFVIFSDNGCLFTSDSDEDFKAAIEDCDDFDSGFCEDEIWIKTFLNRIVNNKPLEIAS